MKKYIFINLIDVHYGEWLFHYTLLITLMTGILGYFSQKNLYTYTCCLNCTTHNSTVPAEVGRDSSLNVRFFSFKYVLLI